jgi:sulfur carrier protein ThiS
MKIDVELSAVFQTAHLPASFSVEIERDEATIRGLLQHLAGQWGEKIRPLLFDEGGEDVLSGLMVMVNDRTFTGTALKQQTVDLHSGDKVSLLYFVSGG